VEGNALRRSRWIGAAALCAVVAGGAATAGALTGADKSQAGPLNVFPAPGTVSASATTQLSFRGAAAGELGSIAVTGSRSGALTGELRPHSDGEGASLMLPELAAGERVTVRTGLEVRGGRDGDFSFTVGRRPTPRQVDDGTLPLPTLPPTLVDNFRSNPKLDAPRVTIDRKRRGTAPGYVFLAPFAPKGSPDHNGPMITDDDGDLVWFKPLKRGTAVTDLSVQRLNGRDVLTWWQGRFALGWGYGDYHVLDETYREVARIRAGNGYRGDLHDMQITPEGTALILAYDRVFRDTSAHGGSRAGVVLDNVIQEIDLETGLVLFEWHSLGNVDVNDSRIRAKGRTSYDYFHVNSVEVDRDGDLLISARNTCAIYKIDRTTGRLLWTLGGKESDFRMNRRTRFCFQHDARRAGKGVISLFDNAAGPPKTRGQSRAIKLAVDERRKTVKLIRAYRHPGKISAPNQGSTRVLPNGNVMVGWGAAPIFSEYSRGGRLLLSGRLVRGKGNYRAIRSEWTGRPAAPPDVAVRERGDRVHVFASWNGATEVARWQVLGGADRGNLSSLTSRARRGVETRISAPAGSRYLAVRALDADGDVLGTSEVVEP
jgi:hypothetical protein